MNYGTEIAALMAEGHKLHVATETHKKECGRDREYRHMWIRQSQIHDRQCELQRQAAQEFAALNGWRWTERRFFARTLVPPILTASWWYPGYARFFCFTRPEVTCVRFLPEQMEPAHGACELPVPPQGANRGDDD